MQRWHCAQGRQRRGSCGSSSNTSGLVRLAQGRDQIIRHIATLLRIQAMHRPWWLAGMVWVRWRAASWLGGSSRRRLAAPSACRAAAAVEAACRSSAALAASRLRLFLRQRLPALLACLALARLPAALLAVLQLLAVPPGPGGVLALEALGGGLCGWGGTAWRGGLDAGRCGTDGDLSGTRACMNMLHRLCFQACEHLALVDRRRRQRTCRSKIAGLGALCEGHMAAAVP